MMNTTNILTPNDFITSARSYINVPWIHQGRCTNRPEIDCVGLVIKAAYDIGIDIEDMQGYRRQADPEKFLGHIKTVSDPAPFAPTPGTVGVFKSKIQPCHVGIFATMYGHPSIIHAYAPARKVVEEVFNHDWPKRLAMVRYIRGIQY